MIKKWGFNEIFRKETPGVPAKKLATVKNPFAEPGKEEELIVVPAIQPDVTLLHVQKADAEGTCRIEGLTFMDVEQAKASKRVVVSCEELVSRDEIRREPDRNQIPSGDNQPVLRSFNEAGSRVLWTRIFTWNRLWYLP